MTLEKVYRRKIGKFTDADIAAHCLNIKRTSILEGLKKRMVEGSIIRYGSGRSTYYVKSSSQ